MTNRRQFNIVNRNLQFLREGKTGGNQPFGGIPVILGGDFQQCLPVVPRGSRADIVSASLQHSEIWPILNVFTLHQNMRLDATTGRGKKLAYWLRVISYRDEYFGSIPLPGCLSRTSSLDYFLDCIYPPTLLEASIKDPTFFSARAILTPRNDSVHNLNSMMLARFPGRAFTLFANDSVPPTDGDIVPKTAEITPEFLNSINGSGLPLAHLQIKIGAPVMVLRNIRPEEGLCNGTRCTIVAFNKGCIKVRLAEKKWAHDPIRLIFPCTLTSTRSELPFELYRYQFPIRLAFAMTINKSQGQSLDFVGIDLRSQVFSHGQLYVAFSRTTNANNVHVLLSEDNIGDKVDNVVYPEVLQAFPLPEVQSISVSSDTQSSCGSDCPISSDDDDDDIHFP